VQRAHPECHVQLWFQDEARFGQQGTLSRVWADQGSRPCRPRQTEYHYVYLFGAVCPATGETNAWLMPVAIQVQLDDLSRQLAANVHAVLVLDHAGWHITPALRVPDNLTLLPLPARSPELNPAEGLWHELRQRHLSNRAYADQTALDDAVATAWNTLVDDPARLRRLCDFAWIKAARKTV
jgi:transposase